MTKASLFFIILALIVFICINSKTKKVMKGAYDRGQKSGYNTGYSLVEEDYMKKIDDIPAEYNEKIVAQTKLYEGKIKESSKSGFQDGKKQKQTEVESNLAKTAAEKEKKQNWNDVLFDVKNN